MSTDKKPLSLVSLKAELDALRDYVSYLKSELERSGIIFRGRVGSKDFVLPGADAPDIRRQRIEEFEPNVEEFKEFEF